MGPPRPWYIVATMRGYLVLSVWLVACGGPSATPTTAAVPPQATAQGANAKCKTQIATLTGKPLKLPSADAHPTNTSEFESLLSGSGDETMADDGGSKNAVKRKLIYVARLADFAVLIENSATCNQGDCGEIRVVTARRSNGQYEILGDTTLEGGDGAWEGHAIHADIADRNGDGAKELWVAYGYDGHPAGGSSKSWLVALSLPALDSLVRVTNGSATKYEFDCEVTTFFADADCDRNLDLIHEEVCTEKAGDQDSAPAPKTERRVYLWDQSAGEFVAEP